jgi:hypothetical protein
MKNARQPRVFFKFNVKEFKITAFGHRKEKI